MAGIVAQFTKANWERLKRQSRYLPPDKSVYFIPPFDERFDPERHNVFMRRKVAFEKMHKQVKCVHAVQDACSVLFTSLSPLTARASKEACDLCAPPPSPSLCKMHGEMEKHTRFAAPQGIDSGSG